MSTEYQEILNRARGEIPEPVDVPSGTWRLKALAGKYSEETTASGDREAAMAEGMIVFQPVEPGADVDEELFAAFAEDSLDGARIFHRFWLHDLRDVQGLNRVFDLMGMPDDLTIKQAIGKVKGFEIMGYVFQKPRKADPDILDTNIKQFAPVED